jgi:hypothetical protein
MRRVPLALFSLAAAGLTAAFAAAFMSFLPSVSAAAPGRRDQSDDRALTAQAPAARAYTGPGSCAAAACHGAIRPARGSRILQTEYTTWIAQDRHARAAQVLSNPVSVRMASLLGLPAAHNAPKCLACHSLDAPESQQARVHE